MPTVMSLFKIMIVVNLFFAVAITLVAYAIPASARNYVEPFSEMSDKISLNDTTTKVQSSIQRQTNIPVIELGALVFYSGNIIIDLLLNFAFALPEMVGLVISGLGLLINLDTFIVASVQLFISALMIVLYFIGLIQLLTGIRSGRIID